MCDVREHFRGFFVIYCSCTSPVNPSPRCKKVASMVEVQKDTLLRGQRPFRSWGEIGLILDICPAPTVPWVNRLKTIHSIHAYHLRWKSLCLHFLYTFNVFLWGVHLPFWKNKKIVHCCLIHKVKKKKIENNCTGTIFWGISEHFRRFNCSLCSGFDFFQRGGKEGKRINILQVVKLINIVDLKSAKMGEG